MRSMYFEYALSTISLILGTSSVVALFMHTPLSNCGKKVDISSKFDRRSHRNCKVGYIEIPSFGMVFE